MITFWVTNQVSGHKRSCCHTFPECLVVCGTEAAACGRCMQTSTALGGHLLKDLCVQEFKALWSCFATMVSVGRGNGFSALCMQGFGVVIVQ
uniref:Uncharacterized protein n=1 Tax=Sus scrofa TaxID=9823 RepID=A0A8W4FAC6_PIG